MEQEIWFHKEDVSFQLQYPDKVKDWIIATAQAENKSIAEVNFIFCSDQYLYRINVDYLDHDTYTDIITFDYSEATALSGDIYISIDRVRENAENFKTKLENELHRVIIHGILHLMGYKDKTEEEKQEMRRKEDERLGELKVK